MAIAVYAPWVAPCPDAPPRGRVSLDVFGLEWDRRFVRKLAPDVHKIRAWRDDLPAGHPNRETDEAAMCGAVATEPGGYLPRSTRAGVTCPDCLALAAGRTVEPTEQALERAEVAGVELRGIVQRLNAGPVPA